MRKQGSYGFTILEILIVVGLICIVTSLGLASSFDIYYAYNFRSEKNLVLGLLQKARSQALNNVDETPHGLYLQNRNYILFEGPDYLHRDTTKDTQFPGNINLALNGLSEVVFSPLAATTTAGSVFLSDGNNKSVTVIFNHEGYIDEY